MSGHAKKSSSITFDKFLLDILKPAYFGLVRFIHKIAFLAIFLGLLGYTFAQLRAQNIDLVKFIFQTNYAQLKTK